MLFHVRSLTAVWDSTSVHIEHTTHERRPCIHDSAVVNSWDYVDTRDVGGPGGAHSRVLCPTAHHPSHRTVPRLAKVYPSEAFDYMSLVQAINERAMHACAKLDGDKP